MRWRSVVVAVVDVVAGPGRDDVSLLWLHGRGLRGEKRASDGSHHRGERKYPDGETPLDE